MLSTCGRRRHTYVRKGMGKVRIGRGNCGNAWTHAGVSQEGVETARS